MSHARHTSGGTALPLRVAVLIAHRPNHRGEVGGLAGTWEQLAQVAGGRPDLDLTLFFLGDRPARVPYASNVRAVLLPPLLGTERLAFLRTIPTHTDLAPFHPALFRRLRGFHLLHATDAFYAFAQTALRRARRDRLPLVVSLQTDTIGWARIHTPVILQRLLPWPGFWSWVLERSRLLDWQERAMERRLARYVRQCRAVFVSHARDQERVRRLAPQTPFFFLRRGIDLECFHPRHRDRKAVEARFGLPPDHLLLLFVGRLDPVKGILIAAEVVQGLVRCGHRVHLLVVGDGAQRQEAARRLGKHATFTGNLPHRELGSLYASADLLLFPSEAEVWPNVVIEARACGLAVVACARGAAHVMRGHAWDGVLLPNRDPALWTAAVETLLAQPHRLRDMGRRARQAVEREMPSWQQVLEEDLLPVWQQVVQQPSMLPPAAGV
ncbi:MAG: glycosyl transferase [Candidatus Tectimicrobiota bacterium]|nr:MAG: glycosyl transferase [Candidatus Tectomicrobia bacterium]